MPRTALFPGSFDPVTNGHLDLVRQATRLADRLVLAIGTHPGKTPLFSVEERRAMLEETCAPIARAGGCDFASITFADLVVATVQTVFLPASPIARPITGTLVRQIASMGGDVSQFVPPSVAARLKQKFSR